MSDNYKSIIKYLTETIEYGLETEEGKKYLNTNKINKHINEINKELIKILLENELCKDIFFDKIIDVYVFNQNKFIDVIFNTNEYMEKSFTKYKNKIGLFVSEDDTIQLNFPYKDCVLLGGMDKEEDNINLEIFYNEVLDKNKINKLFEPKIFNNIKKYKYNNSNIKTENNIKKINFLEENLLIKGNNLLGLHSIEKKMQGMVDVIYIDPPYYFCKNKDKDSFSYNSNFKLSTWLTFMKNRIEIAKKLLSENGIIFISINEDGKSELKILLDEIFEKENFISNIIWRNTGQQQNNGKNIATVTENILCYSKKNNGKNITKTKINDRKGINAYRYEEKEGERKGELFRVNPIQDHTLGKHKIIIEHKLTKEKIEINSRIKESLLWELDEKNLIYWGEGKKSTLPQQKKYLSDNLGVIPSNLIEGIYYENSNKELSEIFDDKNVFSYNKPMELIKYLIQISTKKDSIVLDFFAGSGTTAHAVLNLNREDNGNRKFVLLEQMDYIDSITSERIKRCMIKENYESSFIYMEMKESNLKKIKTKIKNLSDKKSLYSIIEDNFDNGYFINIKNKNELLNLFENLSLNDSIKLLIEKYMDNNNDYISFEDIEESRNNNEITEEEYLFNLDFYKE